MMIVTTETEANLREEVRFLRALVDELVSEHGIPWAKIQFAAQRYRSQTIGTTGC